MTAVSAMAVSTAIASPKPVDARSNAQRIYDPLKESHDLQKAQLEKDCVAAVTLKGSITLRHSEITGQATLMKVADFNAQVASYTKDVEAYRKSQAAINELATNLKDGIGKLTLTDYSPADKAHFELTMDAHTLVAIRRNEELAQGYLKSLTEMNAFIGSLKTQMDKNLPETEAALTAFKGLNNTGWFGKTYVEVEAPKVEKPVVPEAPKAPAPTVVVTDAKPVVEKTAEKEEEGTITALINWVANLGAPAEQPKVQGPANKPTTPVAEAPAKADVTAPAKSKKDKVEVAQVKK